MNDNYVVRLGNSTVLILDNVLNCQTKQPTPLLTFPSSFQIHNMLTAAV